MLISIELGDEETDHLGLMGFFPGVGITAANKAPGGDPRVYRIDHSEIALRNETARHIFVKLDDTALNPPQNWRRSNGQLSRHSRKS